MTRLFAGLIRPSAVALVVAVVAGGCGDAPTPGDPPAELTSEAPEPTAAEQRPVVTTPAARPPVDGCIKGGTTRAEVTALLGPPDSTSFGVWLYGQSELSFGYGVVVAFEDHDGNLQLCPGA